MEINSHVPYLEYLQCTFVVVPLVEQVPVCCGRSVVFSPRNIRCSRYLVLRRESSALPLALLLHVPSYICCYRTAPAAHPTPWTLSTQFRSLAGFIEYSSSSVQVHAWFKRPHQTQSGILVPRSNSIKLGVLCSTARVSRCSYVGIVARRCFRLF